MEIFLSRLLRFLNGALEDNYMFKTASFIVAHYLEMRDFTLDDMVEKSGLTEKEIMDFLGHFALHTFDDFITRVYMDYELRLSQIGLRMIDVQPEDFMKHLKIDETQEEFLNKIKDLCDKFFKAKRIIIFGSHYPSAVAVDFQTDMITFGKEVIDYHHFVEDFKFYEDDVVIMISATGRTMADLDQKMLDQGICKAYLLLITQNPVLSNYKSVCADQVILIRGRYDGMKFNHQLMSVFDIFRIVYFKQFYR